MAEVTRGTKRQRPGPLQWTSLPLVLSTLLLVPFVTPSFAATSASRPPCFIAPDPISTQSRHGGDCLANPFPLFLTPSLSLLQPPASASSRLYMATSSSDLKKKRQPTTNNKNKKKDDKKEIPVMIGPTKTPSKPSQSLQKLVRSNKKTKDSESNDAAAMDVQNRKTVVTRLARAAQEAAAAAAATRKEEEDNEKSLHEADKDDDNKEERERDVAVTTATTTNIQDLPSISALNSVIDHELLHPPDGNRPRRETESMRILLEHNTLNPLKNIEYDKEKAGSGHGEPADASSESTTRKKKTRKEAKQIAVVFARPLLDGQVSVEYASRLVSLAKSIQLEGYRPDLICFCGSSPATTAAASDVPTARSVPEAAAGIVYFRHLCAANDISLEETNLIWIAEPTKTLKDEDMEDRYEAMSSLGESTSSPVDEKYQDSPKSVPWSATSLQPPVEELLGCGYVEKWLDESQVYESETDEYGLTREVPRKKVDIHWTLVSTDYHLCSLNNIHIRSPRQSPMEKLRVMEQTISKQYRGICVNTWSFQYTIYPFVYSSEIDDLTAFLGKCYLTAQELVPVLINLWGVAGNLEFFQKDNYSALVASRRSLASLLEEMNTAFQQNQARKTAIMTVPPTLKARLQQSTDPKRTARTGFVHGIRTDASASTIDIQLEGALLSLGRCCDLVRPAGTFSSTPVSQKDWQQALQHLQDFMIRMEQACDPDRPLPANQWGNLFITSGFACTNK